MTFTIKTLLLIVLCLTGQSLFAQFCARIPYENSRGKIIIKVQVNGIDGTFMFDTGAPVCLTHTFASKVNIQGENEIKSKDSNGQIARNKISTIPSLLLGGVNFNGVQALITEPENMLEQMGVDGIIGYTLFGGKMVEIDSRRRQITIAEEAEYFSLNPDWSMPMVANPYLPLLIVSLGHGQVDTVMLDSGASEFYELSEKSFNRLNKEDVFKLKSRGRGILSLGNAGLEKDALKYKVCIPDFEVGTGKFKNVVSVTTSSEYSRLGAMLLNYGVVTIDYSKYRLYFHPYAEESQDMYRKDWNVIITVMNNELTAGFIWESMWEQLEGGEKIVKINGKRFNRMSNGQAMTSGIGVLTGEKAEIVVVDKKNGKERKLEISKE